LLAACFLPHDKTTLTSAPFDLQIFLPLETSAYSLETLEGGKKKEKGFPENPSRTPP